MLKSNTFIFKQNCIIEGVKDSKKISEKKRIILYKEIYEKALAVEVGIVHNEKIEQQIIELRKDNKILAKQVEDHIQKFRDKGVI